MSSKELPSGSSTRGALYKVAHRMKLPVIKLVWVIAAAYICLCLVLDILQPQPPSNTLNARPRFKLERLPLSMEEKVQVVEYNRRSLRVREVCRAWGAFTSKKKFLRSPPSHSATAVDQHDVTAARDALSRQQLEDIWRMAKKSQMQQLVISRKYRLTWCKVPKAASTSWVHIFMQMLEPRGDAGGGRISKSIRDNTGGGGQHALMRQLYPQLHATAARSLLPFHLKFVVTRHPFERLLSAYRDKLENFDRDLQFRGGYYNTIYGKKIVQTYRTTEDNNTRREPTFREFVRYLLDTDVETYDSHWQPIFILCTPCHIRYDVIASMKTLTQDSQFVLHHIGQDKLGGLEWTHKTDQSTTKTTEELAQRYFKQLLPSEIRQLYYKYLMDFLLFDYDPEPYYNIVDSAAGIKRIKTNGAGGNEEDAQDDFDETEDDEEGEEEES